MDLNLGQTRLIIETAKKEGVSLTQLAYILATAKWETAHTIEPVREAYWLSENWRKANLRYYPWYGRGFVQLTWMRNYKRAGDELGLDLTADPDVVMEPKIAAKILVRGMMGGWFTGKAVPDYITEENADYRNARRIVNGMDRADSIAAIARDYEAALHAYGYDPKAKSSPISALIKAIIKALKGMKR